MTRQIVIAGISVAILLAISYEVSRDQVWEDQDGDGDPIWRYESRTKRFLRRR